MENASKALLIAGAILICILLIGVGVMVFNSVRQPAEESKKTSQTLNDESKKGAESIAVNLKFTVGKTYSGQELIDIKGSDTTIAFSPSAPTASKKYEVTSIVGSTVYITEK